MLGKRELRQIFKDVRENSDKRDACPRHDFGQYPMPPKLRIKLTCKHCGAWMQICDISIYAKGYAAAGGNPEDIIQGFRKTALSSTEE